MQLQSLTPKNWRSYRGEHEIRFSTDPERPLTLVFGANGAGKTALLNAFTWVLYGSFTEGFDRRGQLINLEAAESGGEAAVTLEFEHNGRRYRVFRRADAASLASRKEYAELSVTRDDQATEIEAVHQILPPELKDLFFFPAESFNRSSVLQGEGSAAGNKVSKAILALLMADVYAKAVEDLRNALDSRSLKIDPRGDDKLAEASRQFEVRSNRLREKEERREALPGLIEAAEDAVDEAEREARRIDRETYERHADRQQSLDRAVDEAEVLTRKAGEAYVALAKAAYRPLLVPAAAEAMATLKQAKDAGLMPPSIGREAFEGSIEAKLCQLCRQVLTEEQLEKVRQLADRTIDSDVAQRGMAAEVILSPLAGAESLEGVNRAVSDLLGRLGAAAPPEGCDAGRLAAAVREAIQLADRRKADAEEARRAFLDTPEADAAGGSNPFDRVKNATARLQKLMAEEDAIVEDIKWKQNVADDAKAKQEKLMAKDEKSEQVREARDAVTQAKQYFEALREAVKAGGRGDFERAINETFAQLVRKPYRVSVGEQYSLRVFARGKGDAGERVTDEAADELPLSQSEKVLLVISFLGAIARLAPRYEKIALEKTYFESLGDVSVSADAGYPVVLDSPTSALGKEYEASVIERLPGLLPQLVVPVSEKSIEHWTAVEDRVGAAYVLQLRSNASSEQFLRWGGREHALTVRDDSAATARAEVVALQAP